MYNVNLEQTVKALYKELKLYALKVKKMTLRNARVTHRKAGKKRKKRKGKT